MRGVLRTAFLGVMFGAAGLGLLHAQGGDKAPDYAALRAQRARGLTQPYGWFSLVALDYLKPGVTTVGAAKDNSVVLAEGPAHLVGLSQQDGKVTVQTAAAGVVLDGRPVEGTHPEMGKGEDDASALTSGTLRMWAIDRGGKRYLRVKDSNAPALKGFHGLQWYAPDARYRVMAKWIPYDTPRKMSVLNKLGQTSVVEVPGYVEFELAGQKQTLVPMDADGDGLFFVFRDTTATQATYGAGRFLTTAAPSNGLGKAGTVVLDFNQAVNPPCAYSGYATCPVAMKENRLPAMVRAGEKIYDKGLAGE